MSTSKLDNSLIVPQTAWLLESITKLLILGTAVQHDQHRNASDVPEGDMDVHRSQKRVNYTTTRHHHKPVSITSFYETKTEASSTFPTLLAFGKKF